MPSSSSAVLLASVALLVGCAADPAAPPDDGPTESNTAALTVENGMQLNGMQLNGKQLNGKQLNGKQLNGMQLNGKQLNGRSLTRRSIEAVSTDGATLAGRTLGRIELDETWLRARDERGRLVENRAFVGAELRGLLDDGSALPLRIEAIERVTGAVSAAQAYRVSFGTDQGWEPMCGTDAQQRPIGAIPLAGRWDYRSGEPGGGGHVDDPGAFTFACEGYALAKCVMMGYEPWRSRAGRPLAAYHQACTRMLRADYCGDGRSHTVNGTLINVYDDLGIQRDTESWEFEGEWTSAGARCLTHGRTRSYPTCARALETADCGDRAHFATGTLLMTEDL